MRVCCAGIPPARQRERSRHGTARPWTKHTTKVPASATYTARIATVTVEKHAARGCTPVTSSVGRGFPWREIFRPKRPRPCGSSPPLPWRRLRTISLKNHGNRSAHPFPCPSVVDTTCNVPWNGGADGFRIGRDDGVKPLSLKAFVALIRTHKPLGIYKTSC